MKNTVKLLLIIIFLQIVTKNVLSEPFVVLEYRINNERSFEAFNIIKPIF